MLVLRSVSLRIVIDRIFRISGLTNLFQFSAWCGP